MGLGRVIGGMVVVWAELGHSPFLPVSRKYFHTCLVLRLVHTHLLLHTHMLLHTHRGMTCVHTQGDWDCLLRLTSCPPSLGTKMPSLREEPLLVPRKGQRWGWIW